MRIFVLLLLVHFISSHAEAQNSLVTKSGQITFFSKTPLEDIDATNNEVYANLNSATGDLSFAALIRGFHFRKALMEEHFNENYMESAKYPKASFKGRINNMPAVAAGGTFTVNAEGDLTIHGVTRKVSVPATLSVRDGKLEAVARFTVFVKDYNIKVPSVIAGKIAEKIDISVNCRFDLNK